MIDITGALMGFALMLGLMIFGVHVAVAIFLASALGALVYLSPAMLGTFGTQLWAVMNDFLLTAIPLFILLGELLLRCGVTQRMYNGLSVLLGRLPGGLLHTNIGASGLFAAVSGSSVATAATIATVALPEFKQRGFNERLVLGSIAAGATLGILIPPSVNLIIYGALTGTSVGRLFAAGLIPGLLLVTLFMLAIAIICTLFPNLAGTLQDKSPLKVRLTSLQHLIPPLLVFGVVMGSIYLGWATPTEAAALGVLMALGLAVWNRALTMTMLHAAFLSTVRTTAMILLIIIAAFFLKFVVGVLGVPQALTRFVASMELSVLGFLLVLVVFYLILGCFIETLSMMVGTIPIVFPIVMFMGIDPVWFGIFLVLMMELALITPPIGMNLFVVQGVRRTGSVIDVYWGIIPFVAVLLFATALIITFPSIVTWLPYRLL
ncbi:TRAP transporter large permease [Halomonas dongshanensis]|uniref:TRAP transporter large permease protein n=1 Tax=Halomonas dongshanensis TaxID=2890835 RepID=A0ABT2EBU5_9GAMM|nr:TRAP transporter large permease subunit [Halomonas dongshanensis]MCS2608134.1 TRAP transporter large permease subunit [Halomonas dongshanensis]